MNVVLNQKTLSFFIPRHFVVFVAYLFGKLFNFFVGFTYAWFIIVAQTFSYLYSLQLSRVNNKFEFFELKENISIGKRRIRVLFGY